MTAIDLVVSLAILSILAAIVLTALLHARQRSRDTQRMLNMQTVKTALEIYYNDHFGYPSTDGEWRSSCDFWKGYGANYVIPGLAPQYIESVPSDPLMKKNVSDNCYVYVSNGFDYAFYDYYGTDIDFSAQPTLLDPANDGGNDPCMLDGKNYMAWKVSSDGGRCW